MMAVEIAVGLAFATIIAFMGLRRQRDRTSGRRVRQRQDNSGDSLASDAGHSGIESSKNVPDTAANSDDGGGGGGGGGD